MTTVEQAIIKAARPRPRDEGLVELLAIYLARLNSDNAIGVASFLHEILGYYPFIDLVEIAASWSRTDRQARKVKHGNTEVKSNR